MHIHLAHTFQYYNWSNGFAQSLNSNLCSGFYTLEIVDSAGCQLVDSVFIGQLIYGCTDPTQYNYDITANTDDGSCIPYIYGCTDSTAYNFTNSYNTDDGSCLYCDLSKYIHI